MRIAYALRFLCILLPLTLLLGAVPAAAANEPSVLDAAELDAILAEYGADRNLDTEHFGLAYYYTGTGESYFYNKNFNTYAASLYKVPLCMRLAEKVRDGELALTDSLSGYYTVAQVEEMALVYSSNPHALAGFSAMGNNRSERWNELNRYSGMSLEELPREFDQGYFPPAFMLGTLLTLYNEPERFPGVLDYMQQANPNAYFRRTLESKYPVAQKYGNIKGGGFCMHCAGIIYTPTPFMLVVMTVNVERSYDLLGELAERFAEYTLTLDERVAALLSPTPEPTPTPTAVPAPAPIPEAADLVPERGRVPAWYAAAGGCLLLGIGGLLLRKNNGDY